MNNKAFTLFTALLSFILIVLSMVLISSMTSTSSNFNSIISSVEEQNQMQALADLSSADAIQVFNYGVRFNLERYLVSNTTPFLLDLSVSPEETEQQVARLLFVDKEKKSNPFANIMSGTLMNILQDPAPLKGFAITLERDRFSNQAELTKLLADATSATVDKGEFFQVVECPDLDFDNCPLGTFYVTIDLSEMKDEDYEKLPQIRIENLATGRVIRVPILPKNKFRLYIPLRFFRAIAAARKLANAEGNGMLSPVFHDRLASYGLGMCDRPASTALCGARSSVEPGSNEVRQGKLCPGDVRSTSGTSLNFGTINLAYADFGVLSYNPGDNGSKENALEKIVNAQLCLKAANIFQEKQFSEDMVFLSKGCFNNAPLFNSVVLTRNTGIATIFKSGLESDGGSYKNLCYTVEEVRTGIALQEQNESYIINEKIYESLRAQNIEPAYRIAIQDRIETPDLTPFSCSSQGPLAPSIPGISGDSRETASCSSNTLFSP